MNLIPDNPNSEDLQAAKTAMLSTSAAQEKAETIAIAMTAVAIGMLVFALTMPDRAPPWAMWAGIIVLAIAAMVNGLAVIAHQVTQIRFACIAGSIIAELRNAQPVKNQPAFASLGQCLVKLKLALAVMVVSILAMLWPNITTLTNVQRWGWLALCMVVAGLMMFQLLSLAKQAEVLRNTIRVPVSKM